MITRARKWKDGKPVGAFQTIEASAPAPGIAAKLLRAIDIADARGLGCGTCGKIRKVARPVIAKLARPR